MKLTTICRNLVLSLLFLTGIVLAATPEPEAPAAPESPALEDQRAAYEAALQNARRQEQLARETLERASVDRARAAAARAESLHEHEALSAERAADLAAMREQLSRAHEDLRKASREVARMHRELEHSSTHFAPEFTRINLGDRAVIGVVLGDSNEVGVEVLGVSPDGPSDRAGLQQGDVIVSLMGTPLADSDADDARVVLGDVMDHVKPGDEIVIAVDRDGESLEFVVTAEKREPFAWQSIVRLPSAPTAPGAPVVIEHIEIPEIDGEAIVAQVERIREDLDKTRIVIDTERMIRAGEAPETWEYRFETLSEFGDDALAETSVWFGLPVTRGLKLAEVDEDLGTYFKTDRGVLVLKAREDNELQLKSGDVILQVGEKQVNKPSDVMRALREWEPGSNITIGIKRDRKDRKLDVVMPERTLGFDFVPFSEDLHFNVHVSGN